MKKVILLATLMLSSIGLYACDVVEVASEIINDPPNVESVSYDHESESVLLTITNQPKNGNIEGVYINDEFHVIENSGDNQFKFEILELEYENNINGLSVSTEKRTVRVPLNISIDEIIEEYIEENLLSKTYSFNLDGYPDLVEIKEINYDNWKDIVENVEFDEQKLIDKYLSQELKVVEKMLGNNTVLLFPADGNHHGGHFEYSVTEDILFVEGVENYNPEGEGLGIVIIKGNQEFNEIEIK